MCADLVRKCSRGRETVLASSCERAQTDRCELARHWLRTLEFQILDLSRHGAFDELRRQPRTLGRPAGEHEVEDPSQTKHIRALVYLALDAARLLRGQETGSAEHVTRTQEVWGLAVEGLCEAPIEDSGRTALVEHHIRWLEIAVDHLFLCARRRSRRR